MSDDLDTAEHILNGYDPDEPDEIELTAAALDCALDDLVTAGRNVTRVRDCGTVLALKRAAIDYVMALAADTIDPWDRLPENLLAKLRERVEEET